MTQSASIRRIQRELKEITESPVPDFEAHPLEDNLFEWHFTFRGQEDSDFRGGLYHGRIQFPAEYPMKPPSFFMVTPNGRFEVEQRLCLSNSDFHPESWQPSWSVRTALIALRAYMLERDVGAIGALDFPPDVRKDLARKSVTHVCPKCKIPNCDLLSPLVSSGDGAKNEPLTPTSSCPRESEDGTEIRQRTPSDGGEEDIPQTRDTEQKVQDGAPSGADDMKKREKINALLQCALVIWIITALYRVLFA
eukprot:TRINITY_DN432_c0_g1_i3.p1 TRINITY_DN432_c0_g1~~TRINITY_DN432_c0_g1_i3.p1  ORF type:complete len:250 (+),score=46.23 TRINITY_DN432_c0_g1_i3:100-849(+)